MRVYLLRHGDASTEYPEPNPALSERGQADITRIANVLAQQPLAIKYVFHSGIERAKQTAEIVVQAIAFKGEVEVFEEMQPYDAIDALASLLNQADEDILVVGHMPYLAHLLARMVTSNEQLDLLRFSKGMLVCLKRIESSNMWLIEWCFSPRLHF